MSRNSEIRNPKTEDRIRKLEALGLECVLGGHAAFLTHWIFFEFYGLFLSWHPWGNAQLANSDFGF